MSQFSSAVESPSPAGRFSDRLTIDRILAAAPSAQDRKDAARLHRIEGLDFEIAGLQAADALGR